MICCDLIFLSDIMLLRQIQQNIATTTRIRFVVNYAPVIGKTFPTWRITHVFSDYNYDEKVLQEISISEQTSSRRRNQEAMQVLSNTMRWIDGP